MLATQIPASQMQESLVINSQDNTEDKQSNTYKLSPTRSSIINKINTTNNTNNLNNTTLYNNNEQINQISKGNHKNQLHQIYRMYETERINEMCSANDDSPKLFVVQLITMGKKIKLSEEYPPMLRGYISESYYVEVISQMNHLREEFKSKEMAMSEINIMIALGLVLWVPWIVFVVRVIQTNDALDQGFQNMTRYLESINNCSRNVKWSVKREQGDFKVSVEVTHSKFYRPVKLAVSHF